MDNIRLGILVFFSVAFAAISAWVHINDKDADMWDTAAFVAFLFVIFAA